jgi:hypothetical protein
MIEIGFGFSLGRDGELLRRRAAAQSTDLREYVPHPVTALASGAQLRAHPIEDTILGIDKALQVESVVHLERLPFAPKALRVGRARLPILDLAVGLTGKRAQQAGFLLQLIDPEVQDVANADHADQTVAVLHRQVSHIA